VSSSSRTLRGADTRINVLLLLLLPLLLLRGPLVRSCNRYET